MHETPVGDSAFTNGMFSLRLRLRTRVALIVGRGSELRGVPPQCLIADADTSKFWISLNKAKGNMWHIIHVYMSKIGEKYEFSMKFTTWAPKKSQNGKNQ